MHQTRTVTGSRQRPGNHGIKRPLLKGRDFLSVDDFSPQEIRHIFKLTAEIKKHPQKYRKTLDGKILAMIFEKPSLRTRTTFAVGIKQLGGDSIYLSSVEINLGKRESVYDVAKNLERMVQGIMVRTFAHGTVTSLADYATIPVINGLTDFEHPCQAMADFFTITEYNKDIKNLKLSYVGDGNNVAHSLMITAGKLGATLYVATPEHYRPDTVVVERAAGLASENGGRIVLTEDPREAAEDADMIYTDAWASMGQEAEAEMRREIFRPYQVNRELFSHAKPDALFMHCLPAHRGEEVTDDVIDSKHSVVFPEAENRLHVEKAIMAELMKG